MFCPVPIRRALNAARSPRIPVWILYWVAMTALFAGVPACTAQEAPAEPVLVNVDNFVRAETAAQFDRMLKLAGGINRWGHFRSPTPLDQQPVIRMNRDTLYSFAIVDISQGASFTLPDMGDRYVSVMVVNEDEYINRIFHEPGVHELTMEEFDTPYVLLTGRTLVDAGNPADIAEVNALQDQFVLEAASAKPYTHPEYDEASYKKTYDALLTLARAVPDAKGMFGSAEEVGPVRHLLGAAFGWGGLPESEAFYLNVDPDLPVGEYQITVGEVPVDAFWSVSMYNADGFFEANDMDAYSINDLTAVHNEDGSVTIHLGGCGDGRVNCLPITEGWNYSVRLYRPRADILDGSWTFPKPTKID